MEGYPETAAYSSNEGLSVSVTRKVQHIMKRLYAFPLLLPLSVRTSLTWLFVFDDIVDGMNSVQAP